MSRWTQFLPLLILIVGCSEAPSVEVRFTAGPLSLSEAHSLSIQIVDEQGTSRYDENRTVTGTPTLRFPAAVTVTGKVDSAFVLTAQLRDEAGMPLGQQRVRSVITGSDQELWLCFDDRCDGVVCGDDERCVAGACVGFDVAALSSSSQDLATPCGTGARDAGTMDTSDVGNDAPRDAGGPDAASSPPTCTDLEQNGDETGVDCGEACLLPCGPTVNYRSVGRENTTFATLGTVEAGSHLLALDEDLPQTYGTGDRVIVDGAGEFYILDRRSSSEILLQQPIPTAQSGASVMIRRAFMDPQIWEDSVDGDLVGDNRVEVGVFYSDAPFRATDADEVPMLSVADSTTGPDNFIWIRAAEGHEHGGLASTPGVFFDCLDRDKGGILVRTDHTRIFGLHIAGCRGGWVIRLEAEDITIDRALLRNFRPPWNTTGGDSGVRSTSSNPASGVIRNSIIYDGNYGVLHQAEGTFGLENCTVHGMTRTGVVARYATNTIVTGIDLEQAEPGPARGFHDRRLVQQRCVSEDQSANDGPTSQGRELVFGESVFRSVERGAEDFHLMPDADDDSVRIGITLPTVTIDVDGELRPAEPTDVGADQRQP